MKKNGRTSSGAQRWKCPECDAGAVMASGRTRRLRELESFVSWLRGGRTQEECGGRGFRKRVAWCRKLEPLIDQPPSKRHVLMADGTYVSHNHCLLVLMDGSTGEVIRYRWCAHETIAAYRALFHDVPAPDVLTCDGMRGMQTAAGAEWPKTRLQRCLVHVQRDARRDLTLKPKTQAGKELRKLSLELTRIETAEQAARWAEALERMARALAHAGQREDHGEEGTASSQGPQGPVVVVDARAIAPRVQTVREAVPRRAAVRLPGARAPDGRAGAEHDESIGGRRELTPQTDSPEPPGHDRGSHDARLRIRMPCEKPRTRPRGIARRLRATGEGPGLSQGEA